MSFQNAKIVGVGVSSDAYHSQLVENRGSKDFVMSPSSLKLFSECPSRWKSGYQPPESDAKDFGSLLDTLLLTPDQFDSRYAVIPKTYTDIGMECPNCKSVTDSKTCSKCKAARVEIKIEKDWRFGSKICDEWLTKQGDKKPVYSTELENAQTAAKRLMADETIAELLATSKKQVHVKGEWHDKATGIIVPVQCLIDIVPNGDSPFQKSLCDLKTTRNAGQSQFARWCFTASYHTQAALDLDLFMAAVNPNNDPNGQDRNTWLFIVQENYPPFEIGRRMLSQDFVAIGRQTYQHALGRYARCLKTGVWPQYDAPEEFSLIVPQPFMEFAAMEEVMDGQSEAREQALEDDGDIVP
jgi:PDDEXK-like domain of unknown function (DUF3799)